ncbi:hypothetical protein AT730_18125 [Vibrio alginolyticus]|nr:hypothetical protein AT730_18125 [Vibrio alginolyticus]BCG15101.1 hypothetical protein YZOS03_35840 [Vibrio alginolyticus]
MLILRILTDRGTEYCGCVEQHDYQLYLAINEIDQLEQTDLGFILHLGKQRQYISKSCLSEEVIAFMVERYAASKAS